MRYERLNTHQVLHGRRRFLAAAASIGVAVLSARAGAHQEHQHQHASSGKKTGYVRSLATYKIPDVKLVDASGETMRFGNALAAQDRPVLLNFIFTSCTAVCPIMTEIFSQVQTALGPQRDSIRMISISIDPENDTPAALRAYAAKFGAGVQWKMLTGRLEDSIAVQRAFGVFRGDKMNHQAVTFLRATPREPWVRLDGFASASEILREFHQLHAK